MKILKCKSCLEEVNTDNLELSVCPKCGLENSLEVIDSIRITGPMPVSPLNPGIARIEEKCIKCGQCSKICQDVVGIHYDKEKALGPVCLSCGQCILNCPVGALVPKYTYKTVLNYLHDTDKVVVAFTAPAVRVALGEVFNDSNVNVEGKMVAALKKIGFDYVFDTTFGADLTVMEEAAELVKRIEKNSRLPMFSSCCPAWVKYLETYHPELIPNLSTCKSPIGMQGSIIKSYFSTMMGIESDKIIAVAVTPCTSKKGEITLANNQDTDYVITTSELALMIREQEIDFSKLKDEEFDSIMSRGSGSGVIFGASGGVMEAAIRTAYHMMTGKNPKDKLLDFNEVRGYDNIKEATIMINDKTLNLLVVFGMKNVETVIELINNGKKKYDFIEVMNCPLGCVGGGGQPLGIISKQQEINQNRALGLYQEDKNLKIRNSYENSDIIDLYKSYLDFPLSKRSERLLHTSYQDRSSILGDKSL